MYRMEEGYMRKWLRERRKQKSLTQQQVAIAVHITQPAYGMIEKGKRNPSVKLAKEIGKVLGFDWQSFFE